MKILQALTWMTLTLRKPHAVIEKGQQSKNVKKLPAPESRLIQLVYFEGYTLQDAGEVLGISKSWASRLHAKILESLATEMRQMNLHD